MFGQPPKDFRRLNDVTENLQKGMDTRFGYASVMYQRLMQEIVDFQSSLNSDEEIGAYLASFGKEMYIHIESINYRDPYYIIFTGITSQGDKARLVQHVSQTSILFVPVKVNPEEKREPRRFGYHMPEAE